MLYLYQSNRLEVLAKILAAQLTEDPPPPLSAERLVVPHQGMARWLALRLAEENGICADVDFALPAGFIWQILGGLVEAQPEENRFDPEIMTWSLLQRIPDYLDDPRFSPVAHYWQQGQVRDRYQLARRLARAFDGYLVYRPDWIRAWEAGRSATRNDGWQAELWRAIAGPAPHHWVRLGERLATAVQQGERLKLPQRISLFGVANLSPGYLEIIELLSTICEVHLYQLNPADTYWADLVREWERSGEEIEASGEALYLEIGNPLLASLGKQGQQLFAATAAMNPGDGIDSFIPSQRDDLLGRLQDELLQARDGRDQPGPFDDRDDSLRIHACHGPMREVEALYDQLLGLLEQHPDLTPDQILVMSPDMDRYAPLIEAVFEEPGDRPAIPYSLADRPPDQSAALIETFLSLFELPRQRFALDSCVAILEIPAVARRFGLERERLPQTLAWLEAAGIRWGRDQAHRRRLGLPPEQANSWRAGLERMLLGYAMSDDGIRLFEGIRPYDEIEGSRGDQLGGLLAFANAIFDLEGWEVDEQPPQIWVERLNRLLDRFFAPDPAAEAETLQLQSIRDALEAWLHQTRIAEYRRPCTLEMVLPHLRNQIQRDQGNRHFLAGGVTFCALTPNRILPAEVIVLLGMNDDRFPRDERPPGFDLLAGRWRFGDRSARLEDRYLFLETLISARRHLLATYTGQDIHDNTSRPPSTVISELLDYLDGCYAVDGQQRARQRLVIKHPLQPFSSDYFRGKPELFSYSPGLRRAAAQSRRQRPAPLLPEPLPDPHPIDDWLRIDLRTLTWFIASPARWFLGDRLGIAGVEFDASVEAREAMDLDRFARLDLAQRLITRHRQGWPMARIQAAEAAAQILPHGSWGERLLAQQAGAAEAFVSRLEEEQLPPLHPPLPFQFSHGELQLDGVLQGHGERGIIEIASAPPWRHQELTLWVHHLILNLLAPEGVARTSRIIHPQGEYSLQPVAKPAKHLGQLLDLYRASLNQPPPFLLKSAHAFVSMRRAGKPVDKALAKAEQTWLGNHYYPGEYYSKPWFAQLYPEGLDLDQAFMDTAELVWGGLHDHLTE
jgi:exodeoxyribonuclease V gamma subunit